MQRVFGRLALLAFSISLLAFQKPEDMSKDFKPAEIVSAADAAYPPSSIASGTVVLKLIIGPSGQVEDTRVIRDIPSLTQEAKRSAKQWKFRPATLNGKPIRTQVVAAFTFVNPVLTPTAKG